MVGREGPGTEGAWLLNSRSGNNGAVALATRGGLSLGLKAESGKRCPKKGRLGTEGVGWGCLFSELSAPQGKAAGASFQRRGPEPLWTHSAEPPRGTPQEPRAVSATLREGLLGDRGRCAAVSAEDLYPARTLPALRPPEGRFAQGPSPWGCPADSGVRSVL